MSKNQDYSTLRQGLGAATVQQHEVVSKLGLRFVSRDPRHRRQDTDECQE
jgi:hypothetical protein